MSGEDPDRASSEDKTVLTINCGSSSVKFALFPLRGAPKILSGKIERIGRDESRLSAKAGSDIVEDRRLELPDHGAAIHALFDWFETRPERSALAAIGHRVVHGGPRYREPQRLGHDVVAALRALVPLAPDHLPQEIQAIEAVEARHPTLPQVAVFDTAFHRTLPVEARYFALPRTLIGQGVIRYGFHGLSYEYVTGELRRRAGPAALDRVIVAHLGSGASLAAIRDGKSIDTSMGFTPTGGIPMGTRSGDLDPGILLYLLRHQGLSVDAVDALVNKQAGLLGVSGTSPDMQDLLDRESTDPGAAEAITLFCYQIRKYVGAYAAALGGLDALIFTGGIGENAARVRALTCDGLEFLGIRLDRTANEAGAELISTPDSRVSVRVIPTDEEAVIATAAATLVG